ncbi:12967_t:CDS:1, partial [Acaulospora morrowiae]
DTSMGAVFQFVRKFTQHYFRLPLLSMNTTTRKNREYVNAWIGSSLSP